MKNKIYIVAGLILMIVAVFLAWKVQNLPPDYSSWQTGALMMLAFVLVLTGGLLSIGRIVDLLFS